MARSQRKSTVIKLTKYGERAGRKPVRPLSSIKAAETTAITKTPGILGKKLEDRVLAQGMRKIRGELKPKQSVPGRKSLLKAKSTAKAFPKLSTSGKLLRGAGRIAKGLGRASVPLAIGMVAAESYTARKRGEPLPGDIVKDVIKRAKPLPQRKRRRK